jgi:hypothetical protein
MQTLIKSPNFSALVYTERGTRVRKVMCLAHLSIRRHDLVNKNATNLVRKPCDYCVRDTNS